MTTDRSVGRRSSTSWVRRLRQARQHGIVDRRVSRATGSPGARRPRMRRRRSRYDDLVVVEEAVDGRELECAVLGNDRAAGLARWARSCRAPSSTTTTTSTPHGVAQDRDPGRARSGETIGAGPGSSRCARSACSAPREWHASTCSYGRRRAAGQRDQHHPGVHADLDVPDAVGGVRLGLLRAHRRAGRPRSRTPRTAIQTEQHQMSGRSSGLGHALAVAASS